VKDWRDLEIAHQSPVGSWDSWSLALGDTPQTFVSLWQTDQSLKSGLWVLSKAAKAHATQAFVSQPGRQRLSQRMVKNNGSGVGVTREACTADIPYLQSELCSSWSVDRDNFDFVHTFLNRIAEMLGILALFFARPEFFQGRKNYKKSLWSLYDLFESIQVCYLPHLLLKNFKYHISL